MGIRHVLLFAAGCVFAALLMPLRPEGAADRAEQGVLLWLAFYPFAVSTSVPIRAYWFVLIAGLPVALLAGAAGETRARLDIVTLVVFTVALAGTVISPVLKRRRQRQA